MKGSVGTFDKNGAVAGKRRRVIFMASALIVILLCVGAFGIYHLLNREVELPEVFDGTPDASSEIASLQIQGKADEARAKAGNGDSKDSLLALAIIEYNASNWQKSCDLLKQLETKYGLDKQVASNLARCFEKLGDNKQAIAYYQKEIDIIRSDSTNPVIEDDVANITKKIEALK